VNIIIYTVFMFYALTTLLCLYSLIQDLHFIQISETYLLTLNMLLHYCHTIWLVKLPWIISGFSSFK